jgi:hypothetical protein
MTDAQSLYPILKAVEAMLDDKEGLWVCCSQGSIRLC